ncbi:hypothetical protein ACFRMQ_29915 [Kitasatospora sp. NPDC056783]|uniref:hypothetical protein n=1 Tax=Kitasatospora sp. NPDC056783 TaxID=3345943 RepID=UPI0036C083FD
MESEQSPEEPGGLKAIWANTLEPVAPLPWYRRVSLKLVGAGVVVVGLATALTVAAVTGAGAPTKHQVVMADEIGHQVRIPEDASPEVLRAAFGERAKAFRYQDLTVGHYGAVRSAKAELTVIGLTGSFRDPQRELNGYFGDLARSSMWQETVSERAPYPPGPLGGALECAALDYTTTQETTCVWADADTVGIVTDNTGRTAPEDLAQRALEVREAVEVAAED